MPDLDVAVNLALRSFEQKLRAKSANLRQAVKEAEAALNEALPQHKTSREPSPAIPVRAALFERATPPSSVPKPQRARYKAPSSVTPSDRKYKNTNNSDTTRHMNMTNTAEDNLQFRDQSKASQRVSANNDYYRRSLSSPPRAKCTTSDTIHSQVYGASSGRTLKTPLFHCVALDRGDSDSRAHIDPLVNDDEVDSGIGTSRDMDGVVGRLIRRRALVWRRWRQRIMNDATFALGYSSSSCYKWRTVGSSVGSSTAYGMEGDACKVLQNNEEPRRPGSDSYCNRGAGSRGQANQNVFCGIEASGGLSSFGDSVGEENTAVSIARVVGQAHRINRGDKLRTTPRLPGVLPSDESRVQEEKSLDTGSRDHLDNASNGTHHERKADDSEMQAFEEPRYSKRVATSKGDKKIKGLHGAGCSCWEQKQRGDALEYCRRHIVFAATGRSDYIEHRMRCSPANEAAFVGNNYANYSAGACLVGGEKTPSPLPSPPSPCKPTARPKIAASSQQSASPVHQSFPSPLQSSTKHSQTDTTTKRCTDAATQVSTDEDLNCGSDFPRGMTLAPETIERHQQVSCQTSKQVCSQSHPALVDNLPPVRCGTPLRDRVEYGEMMTVTVSLPAANDTSPDPLRHCTHSPEKMGIISQDGSTSPTSGGDGCSMTLSLPIDRIPRDGDTAQSRRLCSHGDRQRCSSSRNCSSKSKTIPTEFKTCEDRKLVASVPDDSPCKVTYSGDGAEMTGTSLVPHSEEPRLGSNGTYATTEPLLVKPLRSTNRQSSRVLVSKRTEGEEPSPIIISGNGGQEINDQKEGTTARPGARCPGHEKSDIISGGCGDGITNEAQCPVQGDNHLVVDKNPAITKSKNNTVIAVTSGSPPQARDGGILGAAAAAAARPPPKPTTITPRPGCERESSPMRRNRGDDDSVVISVGARSVVDDKAGLDKPPLLSSPPHTGRRVRTGPIMIEETLGELVSNAWHVVPPAAGVSAPRRTRVLTSSEMPSTVWSRSRTPPATPPRQPSSPDIMTPALEASCVFRDRKRPQHAPAPDSFSGSSSDAAAEKLRGDKNSWKNALIRGNSADSRKDFTRGGLKASIIPEHRGEELEKAMKGQFHALGHLESLGITAAAFVTKGIETRGEARPTQKTGGGGGYGSGGGGYGSGGGGYGGGDATRITTACFPEKSEHQAAKQSDDINIGSGHNNGGHAIWSVATVAARNDDEHGRVSCCDAATLTPSVNRQRRCSNNYNTLVMQSDKVRSGEGTIRGETASSAPSEAGTRFSFPSRDRPWVSTPISSKDSSSGSETRHRLNSNVDHDWSANSGRDNSKVRPPTGSYPSLMTLHPELMDIKPAAMRWRKQQSGALFAEFITASRRNNARTKAFGNPLLETWGILHPLLTAKSGKEKLF